MTETQDALARKMAIEFMTIADDTRAVEVRVLSVSEACFTRDTSSSRRRLTDPNRSCSR